MSSSLKQLFGLDGETALVIGGMGSIGHTMAMAMAEAGADVLLDQAVESTKNGIERLGRKAVIYDCHLASQESATRFVSEILADGHKIHVLLICGSVRLQHASHAFPEADWTEVLRSNLTNTFTLCREVGKHMLEREPNALGRRGSIVNVSLPLLYHGGIEMPANAASKGGVGQLTKALSNEWAANGIRVNAIELGSVATVKDVSADGRRDTDRVETQAIEGKDARSEDLKSSLIYFASPASGYVTGTIITVNVG